MLGLASCSEGQYWNEPSAPGQVVAFAKPAETLNIEADAEVPAVYEVTVSRNEAGAALTVPVAFESSSDVLSGPESVTFEAGCLTAKYPISIASTADILTPYTATLTLEQPEDALLHVNAKNLTFSFNFQRTITFEWADAGMSELYSVAWVENEEGVQVPVEECTNWPVAGERLFRLVSPYWYLEPEYAEQGYDIAFVTDDSGNALRMYSDWQYMGEVNEGEYYFFGTPAAYGCTFTSDGNHYTMDGVVGYAASLTGSIAPGWFETLEFLWDAPFH